LKKVVGCILKLFIVMLIGARHKFNVKMSEQGNRGGIPLHANKPSC